MLNKVDIFDFKTIVTIQRFEDIIAWQKAQDLAVKVYTEFGNSRDYNFKDQICRAAVSVSNNIAEGFDRNTTSKEFHDFFIFRKVPVLK